MNEIAECRCGGKAVECEKDFYDLRYVKCPVCGAQTPECFSESIAALVWNDMQKDVEDLEDARASELNAAL